jgi:small subunit ribosomal protein S17
MSETATGTAQGRGRRQTLIGTVVSDKMDKTVVVAVERRVTHALYKRHQKRTHRFYAHDEKNECGIGDRVEIVSSRPLSRLKRWRVGRVLQRAEG